MSNPVVLISFHLSGSAETVEVLHPAGLQLPAAGEQVSLQFAGASLKPYNVFGVRLFQYGTTNGGSPELKRITIRVNSTL